jgi:hypothetical protein
MRSKLRSPKIHVVKERKEGGREGGREGGKKKKEIKSSWKILQ